MNPMTELQTRRSPDAAGQKGDGIRQGLGSFRCKLLNSMDRIYGPIFAYLILGSRGPHGCPHEQRTVNPLWNRDNRK
jgi:hypothetical protein